MPGIGLLNEKPLHASLKEWYAQPGDQFEVPVGGFVIDIVQDDVLLEIQTGSFAAIKAKLAKLLESHQIRLIYPIAQEKWIVRLTKDDRAETRRKSTKRGRVEDVYWELVSIPQLIARHNLSLEVLMIRGKRRGGTERRKWRRKGWVIAERRLLEVVDRRLFDKPADWLALTSGGIQPFTARCSEAMGISLGPGAEDGVFLTRSETGEVDRQARAGRSLCGWRLTRDQADKQQIANERRKIYPDERRLCDDLSRGGQH